MDPFSRLGEFEIAHLVEFLEPIDIISLQRVSKLWQSTLSSDYISRIALLHHFPYVSQSRELRDSHSAPDTRNSVPIDATLLWRRVAYQYHTRRMGQPTRMHQLRLDYTLQEWDVAEGYAAWISNLSDEKVLRVQTLEGPDEGRLREIELSQHWLEYDEKDVPGWLRVVTMKIVKGLAILSLEYSPGWGGFTHPPWSGNRAKFLVVDLKSMAPLLWKYRMDPQQTILGEVEWSEDKLYYLRRTPIRSFSGLDTRDRSAVHFVIHDMFTGAITQEIALENGNELVAYRDLAYDVMVVDRPLKHFILVRDHGGSPLGADLMATIYTLTGKIVGKFLISPEQIVPPNGNITRNIFVDFTHRHDVFNITETFYCDFNEQDIAGNMVDQEYKQFPPEAFTFNSWSIYPQKNKKKNKKGGFEIEQREHISPVTERESLSLRRGGGGPEPTSRFDILFSTLDVSVICYGVDEMEFGIDVGVYEKGTSNSENSGRLRLEQVARRKLSDKRLINRNGGRKSLQLEKYFEKVINLGEEMKGGEKYVENRTDIARFAPEKGLVVKGIVHSDYWSCVEWCDRYLTFHTYWSLDDDFVSGILVLDFHPPW